MTFRSPELLALARLAPSCMACGARNAGQVVAAHSNAASDGKGMALKASDAAVAFLCDICHAYVDQGAGTQAERRERWTTGHFWTMRWLIESGNLVVRPADYVAPVQPPKAKARVGKGRGLPKGRKIPAGPKMQSRNTLQRKKP